MPKTAPTISPEVRAAGLANANRTRRARVELRDQIKAGRIAVPALLDRAQTDQVAAGMRIGIVLEALPGIGKAKASQALEGMGIDRDKRLRALGAKQREALAQEFAPAKG